MVQNVNRNVNVKMAVNVTHKVVSANVHQVGPVTCARIDVPSDSSERNVKRRVNATTVHIVITLPANVNVLPVLLATNATIIVPAIRTVRIARKHVAAKILQSVMRRMASAFVPVAGKTHIARFEFAPIISMVNTAI